MGYTHYWDREKTEIPLKLWRKALARIRPIVEAAGGMLQDVKLSDDAVFFNGTCETFYVQRVFEATYPSQEGCFAFCKTRADAYDPVVVACLVILAQELKGSGVGFTWDTDGNWPAEHRDGLELAGISAADAVAPSRG